MYRGQQKEDWYSGGIFSVSPPATSNIESPIRLPTQPTELGFKAFPEAIKASLCLDLPIVSMKDQYKTTSALALWLLPS